MLNNNNNNDKTINDKNIFNNKNDRRLDSNKIRKIIITISLIIIFFMICIFLDLKFFHFNLFNKSDEEIATNEVIVHKEQSLSIIDDVVKENVVKENVVKENVVEENVVEENVIEENIIEEQVIDEENEIIYYSFEEFDANPEEAMNGIIRHNEIEYTPFDIYELEIPRKTFISLHEKFKINATYEDFDKSSNIYRKYCIDALGVGDAMGTFKIKSNYEQYNCIYWGNKTIELKKYKEPIEFKISASNEFTWMILEKKYGFINIDDWTDEELMRLQYEYGKNTVQKDEYNGTDGFFKINGISIMNGNNINEEKWKDCARAKKIKLTFENQEYIFELEDIPEIQVFDIGYLQNTIEKPVEIKIEVLDFYPGEKSNDVYIYDIRFGASTSIRFGR